MVEREVGHGACRGGVIFVILGENPADYFFVSVAERKSCRKAFQRCRFYLGRGL